MRRKLFMASLALSTAVTAGLCGLSYANEAAAAAAPIGRVTAAFGHTSIRNENGSRTCDLQALINNDDRIVTNGGGISVLLASRVVIKLDARTCVAVREGDGQTSIVLEYGTVHVFVGQRPADYGKVVLIDPQTRLEAADGVFLASYNPDTRESYHACEQKVILLKTDGEAPVDLPAEEQAIIRNGKLASNGKIDRIAFMDRKQSFEQLGQSAVAQGANTFRLRSRMVDTEVAISQLSAAGWIDRQALVQAQINQQQAREEEAQNSDESSDTTTTEEGQKTTPAKKPEKSNNKPSNPSDNAVATTPEAPANTPTVSIEPDSAPSRPTNDAPVAQTPAVQAPVTQAPVTQAPPPVTVAPPSMPSVVETPVTQVPVEVTPSKPAPAATPVTPAPSAIDLAPSIAPSTPVVNVPGNLGGTSNATPGNGVGSNGKGNGLAIIPVDAPSVPAATELGLGDGGNSGSSNSTPSFDDSGKSNNKGKSNTKTAGNSGKGSSPAITKAGGGGSSIAPPSLPTVETSKGSAVPKIDLNIGGSASASGGGSSGSSNTLGGPGGGGGAAAPPPVSAAPKINIDIPKLTDVTGSTGKNTAPPKADLGLTPNSGSGSANSGSGSGGSNSGSGSSAAPPVISVETPMLPPKIDLNIDAPTPKIDTTAGLNIPKVDGTTGTVVPKVEGVAPEAPIVKPGDLNIVPKDGVGAAPPTPTDGATPAILTPTEAGETPPAIAGEATTPPTVAPEVTAPQRQNPEKPKKPGRRRRG